MSKTKTGLYVHVNKDLLNHIMSMPSSLDFLSTLIEPPHEKTNNLHMRKQRRRSVSR